MSRARLIKRFTILNAKASTGIGTNIENENQSGVSVVHDYALTGGMNHLVVTIVSDDSADLTVKCLGANFKPNLEAIDFTAASRTDTVKFIEMISENTQATKIVGATGLVISTDVTQSFRINVDNVEAINFEVTARVAGNVTVYLTAATNA